MDPPHSTLDPQHVTLDPRHLDQKSDSEMSTTKNYPDRVGWEN